MNEQGYDVWGVRLPNGSVREFSTLAKAELYQSKMEGQLVMNSDGTMTTWTGLVVVHRFIPPWTEITGE